MKGAQLLGSWGHWKYQSAGTRTASATGVMAPSLCQLVIRRPLWLDFLHCSTCSCTERAPFLGVLLCYSSHQAHKGAPWLGSYSVVWYVRHLIGHPGWGPTVLFWHVRHLNGFLDGVLLCCSTCQVLDGLASLLFSYQC